MNIDKPSDFGKALRQGPYAWPGGYPLYFICDDGAPLSFESARKEGQRICQAIRERSRDGWRVVAVEINYEEPDLICAHSNKPIESAYL